MTEDKKTPSSPPVNTPNDMVAVANTRQRILAAALKLFVEQGYFNTNIPDLSRLSKCSVGSIYHSFENKEQIAAALYQESIGAFRSAMAQAIGDETDSVQVLRKMIKALMTFSQKNVQLSRYIWLCRHKEFMSQLSSHPTRIGFDALGRRLTRALKDSMKKGIIQDLPAQMLWSVLFGIPLAYVRDWLDGFNPTPPEEVADTVCDICIQALKVK